MPELPEVETVKRQLEEVLKGTVISEVELLGEKSWEGDEREVVGAKVVGMRRRGKGLIFDLVKDGKRMSLVAHLKMTGQFIYQFPSFEVSMVEGGEKRIVGGHPTNDFIGKLPSGHTRVVFKLKVGDGEGGVLYFNDQRKFGWIKMMPTERVEELSFIKNLGPEPWELSDEEFVELLGSSRKPVKVRIMDQDRMAGVGNIYANDALWEAGIDPRRMAKSLSREEAGGLLVMIRKVLEEGIFYGGATAADGKFVLPDGMGGKYQEHFRAYQREGEPCGRCGGVFVKGMIGGRGTFWCEGCQG